MSPRKSTRSLWLSLLIAVLLVAITSFAGGFLFTGLNDADLEVGLSNIAALGGVASGLSLAGTSVLSLNAPSVKNLINTYGTWIRGVLFGGYAVMIVASFAAGVGAMFTGWDGAPWLIAATSSVILCGLLATAALINSAFRWANVA